MLSALIDARKRLKPYLPRVARRAMRAVWHGLILPPVRAYAGFRERAGTKYDDPPPHVLAQYGLTSPDQRRRVGTAKREMIEQHLRDVGLSIPNDARILDFGCGAVGTLSAFARAYPDASCYGCDLKADVVSWAKRYRPNLRVEQTSPMPPLPNEFRDFDLVYAISVWTHMTEEACSAWLQHMHERTEGVLFFTIVEPTSRSAANNGYDPELMAEKVRKNAGCFYDTATDVTLMQKEWLEREAEGRFNICYFGPAKGHNQWAVVLTKQ